MEPQQSAQEKRVGPLIFQVVYDGQPRAFHQGDEIIGNILLVLARNTRSNAIYLVWKGEVEVEFFIMNSGDAEQRRFHNSRDIFHENIIVIGDLRCGPSYLSPGHYNFEFKVRVPYKVPESFTGNYGVVKYMLRAVISRPTANFDYKSPEVIVPVFGRLNPNPFPRILETRLAAQEKHIRCCFCAGGLIGYSFTLPRRGFILGERINLQITLRNHSRMSCTFKVQLIQVVKCVAEGYTIFGSKNSSAIEENMLTNVKKNDVVHPFLPNCVWDVQLKIPASEPPSWLGRRNISDILSVQYYVRVYVDIPWYPDMQEDILVIVGTVPMENTQLKITHPGIYEHSYHKKLFEKGVTRVATTAENADIYKPTRKLVEEVAKDAGVCLKHDKPPRTSTYLLALAKQKAREVVLIRHKRRYKM